MTAIDNTGARWSEFEPRAYLAQWYSAVTIEITATLDFLRRSYAALPVGAKLIDFCSGPTIYQYLAAAPRVAEIHACDYLPQNLAAIREWLDDEPAAFDWTPLISEALRLELGQQPDAAAIAERATLVRHKVTRLLPCDMYQEQPLGPATQRIYDALSMCYGADSVVATLAEWEAAMANCCSVLKPGGTLIAAVVKDSRWWALGERRMQAVALNEEIVAAALERIGFAPASIRHHAERVADAEIEGYDEVLFITARLAG